MLQGLIARRNSDGRLQNLQCHLENVATICASVSHYPNISKLIAYLHDLGKSSAAFQNYIKNGGKRGSVIHAWQGAFLANELFSDNSPAAALLKEIIVLCVTAHHRYLEDAIAPNGTTDYFDRFSNANEGRYFFDEIKGKVTNAEKDRLCGMFDDAKPEMLAILTKIRSVYQNCKSAKFALGLFVKYFYSCLVDADRLDAYLFDINEAYSNQRANWDLLTCIFEEGISGFKNTSKIDSIRGLVSEKCKAAAAKETGIYQLSVPTGGGKTLSSLRFALHHCKKHEKKRIIYVIPYLSIIEQTAKNMRDILNLPEENEIIFEHHSNITEPEDEKASEMRELSAARWDSPIIITTMVVFMETVMSAKSGQLRKFASMADSVIIFDEIQTIPIKAIHCFNEIVSFLSEILNSTVILCSATQPCLEATQRKNLLIRDKAGLIECANDFKDVKRVRISVESEKDCNAAADFVLEKADMAGNCLVIVNTKKSALEIYSILKSKPSNFEIFHLSTSMCPCHRMETIDKVKDSLKGRKRVICVSTQLIEAGVDISFSCVVRGICGLDSIAQAAGRCNRNSESVVPKTVYTFALKDENLDRLIDIKSGKEITEQILQSKTGDFDLRDEEIMSEYYRRYFDREDTRMDYPTNQGETIYAMLSANEYGKQNHINQTGKQFSRLIPQAFHSADSNFSMIEKNTKSVVVSFGESESLLEKYRKLPAGILTKERVKIQKKLQKYSVALYEWQFKKLIEQNALYQEGDIFVLSRNHYSQETGVVLEADYYNLII